MRQPIVSILLLALSVTVSAKSLASRLAAPATRYEAIARITKSDLPTLLRWTDKPPKGVDEHQLDLALMEVFRRLRAKEAVPFLIRNMTMDISGLNDPDVWMRAEGVIETRIPALEALIAVGQPASQALVAAPWNSLPLDRQLATLFVVSKIADPSARGFLKSTKPRFPQEARWIEQGLAAIDAKTTSPATR